MSLVKTFCPLIFFVIVLNMQTTIERKLANQFLTKREYSAHLVRDQTSTIQWQTDEASILPEYGEHYSPASGLGKSQIYWFVNDGANVPRWCNTQLHIQHSIKLDCRTEFKPTKIKSHSSHQNSLSRWGQSVTDSSCEQLSHLTDIVSLTPASRVNTSC